MASLYAAGDDTTGHAADSSTKITLDPVTIEVIAQLVISNFAPKIDEIIRTSVNNVMAPIQHNLQQLTNDNDRLSHENGELRARVLNLENEVDQIEQYSRRNCARISGIPESTGESTDNIVLDLAKEMKVDLSLAEIDRSHRVGRIITPGRPRQIIVKFTSYRARYKVFSKRRDMKTNPKLKNIYVNEDLTYRRNKLLYEARQAVKNKHIIGAWSFDGSIFIKDKQEAKMKLGSFGDLEQLILN